MSSRVYLVTAESKVCFIQGSTSEISCLSNYLYYAVLNADELSLLSLADGNSH